jgi:hypothetical protein
MSINQEQHNHFHQFATAGLNRCETELTIDDLLNVSAGFFVFDDCGGYR